MHETFPFEAKSQDNVHLKRLLQKRLFLIMNNIFVLSKSVSGFLICLYSTIAV